MSSTKRFLAPVKVISAGDLSAATVTSTVIDTSFLDSITVQANILTGTPTGTFTLQVSLDKTNWITLSIVPNLTTTAGSPAVLSGVYNTYGWAWARVLYTKSSGTGTADVYIAGKAS